MGLTVLLSLAGCALLFLGIWGVTVTMPTKLLAKNFPQDVQEALTDEEQRKLHLDFGEKDFDWRYSKKAIPVYMPNAGLKIRPGYAHCGYMAAETEKYVREIEAFIF